MPGPDRVPRDGPSSERVGPRRPRRGAGIDDRRRRHPAQSGRDGQGEAYSDYHAASLVVIYSLPTHHALYQDRGLVQKGDNIVGVHGLVEGVSGATNLLKVLCVE